MNLGGRGSTALLELVDIEKEFKQNERISVSKSHEYMLTSCKNISKTRMIDNIDRDNDEEVLYDLLLEELNSKQQWINMTTLTGF